MPLTKTPVPIQFGGGLNSKIDPKQLPIGNLLDLQNGQFSKQFEINKRFGYNALSNATEGGSDITSGVAIEAYNNELLLFDGTYVNSFIEATGQWINKGVAISLNATDVDVIRTNDDQQLNPDVALCNGIEVYAWNSSLNNSACYSVKDTDTGNIIVNNIPIAGTNPKCITFQKNIYIFYTAAYTLYYQAINPYNPSIIQPQVEVFGDGYALKGVEDQIAYDVAVVGDSMFIGWLSDDVSTGQINLMSYNSALIPSSVVVVEATPGKAIGSGSDGYVSIINVCGDASNNVWISWWEGTNVRSASYTNNLLLILADTIVDTIAGVATLSGIDDGTDTNTILLLYGSNVSTFQTLYVSSINNVGTVSAELNSLLTADLASKCFSYAGNIYVNIAFQSTDQSTYFTILVATPNNYVDVFGNVVGKYLYGTGGGYRTNWMLSETPVLSSGIFKFANLIKGQTLSESNVIFNVLGVNATTLDFVNTSIYTSAEQSSNLHITGATLQMYDGISVIEHNFHLFPEGMTASIISGTSALSTGQYQYVACYSWQDNIGQTHFSTPSPPITISVEATQTVQLVVPCLALTQKSSFVINPRSDISIVIYRTGANGSVFNQITSNIAPLLNSISSQTVSFDDDDSDVSIESNAPLYTSGGVLPNQGAPANSMICLYQDRLFLSGMEDGNLLWFSQNKYNDTNFNTIPVEFSADLTMGVDNRGGSITAIGNLNGNIVIFKGNYIFITNGDGPDNTGLNGSFPDPVLISTDVGCINPNSVVIMPNGLMFQSAKGIYLLGTDQSLQYVGAPVEQYNGLTLTSSTLIYDYNQVVFTSASGTTLVYDYYFNQWGIWTNQYIVDSVIFNGTFCYLTAQGLVMQQDPTVFTDAGRPILMSWTLPDIAINNSNGRQMVYNMSIVGTSFSPISLQFNVAYNYNSIFTESGTYVVNIDSNVYGGSDGYYGYGTGFYGGTYTPFQFRYNFANKKNTSIRVQVNELQSSDYGQGYSISACTFEVGIIPGAVFLPATATIGGS